VGTIGWFQAQTRTKSRASSLMLCPAVPVAHDRPAARRLSIDAYVAVVSKSSDSGKLSTLRLGYTP